MPRQHTQPTVFRSGNPMQRSHGQSSHTPGRSTASVGAGRNGVFGLRQGRGATYLEPTATTKMARKQSLEPKAPAWPLPGIPAMQL